MGKYFIEDLKIGSEYREEKCITREDIDRFAEVSGDYSPIHMDEQYAQNTRFGSCISHGMLLGAYVSKIIGMHMPGEGTIYVSQNMKFMAPVYVGTKVSIVVKTEAVDLDKNRATLRTMCYDQEGKILMEGEAVVLPPKK